MIRFNSKGDFSKATRYFKKALVASDVSDILDKYGKRGVSALAASTPVDSGLTASSWYYKVHSSRSNATLTFHNSNINNGVPIAVILQYGHGTGTGGWVEGRDYINPAIQPIFDEIVEEAWKEVTSL